MLNKNLAPKVGRTPGSLVYRLWIYRQLNWDVVPLSDALRATQLIAKRGLNLNPSIQTPASSISPPSHRPLLVKK